MELVSQASGIRYEIAEGEHTVGRGPWLQARRWIHESVCLCRLYISRLRISVCPETML